MSDRQDPPLSVSSDDGSKRMAPGCAAPPSCRSIETGSNQGDFGMDPSASDDQKLIMETSGRLMDQLCPLTEVRAGAYRDAGVRTGLSPAGF